MASEMHPKSLGPPGKASKAAKTEYERNRERPWSSNESQDKLDKRAVAWLDLRLPWDNGRGDKYVSGST